jgi:hypothetical protein
MRSNSLTPTHLEDVAQVRKELGPVFKKLSDKSVYETFVSLPYCYRTDRQIIQQSLRQIELQVRAIDRLEVHRTIGADPSLEQIQKDIVNCLQGMTRYLDRAKTQIGDKP